MNIIEAFALLEGNKKVRRKGWGNLSCYLRNSNECIYSCYLLGNTTHEYEEDYTPVLRDVLANDWELFYD